MKQKYDVVIVGTGVAGCFAALHLPQDLDILMITKAGLEESSSFLAQGGICVLRDENDYESFFEDTLKAGHYENKRESVDVMIRSSREIINELMDYGVEFNRENGALRYTREGAHSRNRILYHEDITGEAITTVLLNRVQELENVEILTHTAMVDILERNNCCHGILARMEDGSLEAIQSRDVIWACGGIGGIYENSTNFPHLTGDALAISLRHGIKLKNVNYVQIHPTTLYSTKPGRRFLISESVRGEGAVLYNKNMERFVNELLPRDLLTQEIHKQMEKDGTPFVWLSMMTIQGLDIEERFPHIYQKCMEEGYDPKKECIPVVPSQHYFMGGVEVGLKSETSMEHLYASGETCCNGVHGANRLASNSLLESLVFARLAAWDIAGRRQGEKPGEALQVTDWEQLEKEYGLRKEDYLDYESYMRQCKERIWEEIERENREGN